MRKIFFVLAFVCYISSAYAADYKAKLEELINSEMKAWSQSEEVSLFLKSQNEKNADLSESDFKILNSRWQAEKRKLNKTLTDKVLGNELSGYLKEIEEKGQGVYTEIIIIDKFGLSAGQSMDSLNYFHAGEKRWDKTFGSNSYAAYISDLHFDDNTNLFQVDVAFMIFADEEAIGVAYAGIDVEQLEEWKKRREAF